MRNHFVVTDHLFGDSKELITDAIFPAWLKSLAFFSMRHEITSSELAHPTFDEIMPQFSYSKAYHISNIFLQVSSSVIIIALLETLPVYLFSHRLGFPPVNRISQVGPDAG